MVKGLLHNEKWLMTNGYITWPNSYMSFSMSRG